MIQNFTQVKATLLTFALICMFSCNSSKSMLPDDSDKPMTENPTDTSNHLTYLALGDSYTIGEGVSDSGRYPSQLIAKLNSGTSSAWAAPKVVAQTGWTVDELDRGINSASIENSTYDLVTLSIGVNNQYRGYPISRFEKEFEAMLLRAIGFAGVNSKKVVVLSIPDWGITPFAQQSGRDQNKIADEIDAYNSIKEAICQKHEVKYIDITQDYRTVGAQAEMLAADGLHPSTSLYQRWTEKLFEQVKTINF
ncbi:SGNH/GDSL hydrolase family protein [Algoriphagus sp.]|uniref:SGNH/GDSL hydrolase family protein n=1 Tax=Algoriphagus sp. TaxID=1872435 RepID=UPI003F714C3E